MKSLLVVSAVFCAFCLNSAAQSSGATLSAQPQIFQVADHPSHASQQAMEQGINLMERSGSVSDQGEMPLWEAMQAMPPAPVTPLGDAARALKKEHEGTKKAVILWSN